VPSLNVNVRCVRLAGTALAVRVSMASAIDRMIFFIK